MRTEKDIRPPVPTTPRVPLGGLIEDYLELRRSVLSDSTLEARRRELRAFARWCGVDRDIADVTRRLAATYASDVLRPNGNRGETNRDKVGHLHAFFAYAIERDLYTRRNPWARLGSMLVDTNANDVRAGRRPWSREELLRVFSQRSARHNVWEAGVLALYTGARLEELCSIRVTHVDLDAETIDIGDRRLDPWARKVPIHPVALPLVALQCSESTDGFLLHGESTRTNRRYGRNLSRRFTHWLRGDNGIIDRHVVFDSLRYNFSDTARAAGVPDKLRRWLLGQQREASAPGVPPAADATALSTSVAAIRYGALDDRVGALLARTRRIGRPRRRA